MILCFRLPGKYDGQKHIDTFRTTDREREGQREREGGRETSITAASSADTVNRLLHRVQPKCWWREARPLFREGQVTKRKVKRPTNAVSHRAGGMASITARWDRQRHRRRAPAVDGEENSPPNHDEQDVPTLFRFRSSLARSLSCDYLLPLSFSCFLHFLWFFYLFLLALPKPPLPHSLISFSFFYTFLFPRALTAPYRPVDAALLRP